MDTAERREAVLTLVSELGYASVDDLGRRLAVSQMTVRRDLQRLEDEGLLRRTHGGATLVSPRGEPGLSARAGVRLAQKRAVGRAAAELVVEGQTVVLDVGTTTLEIARQLAARADLTVITNSLRALEALGYAGGPRVIATGGTLKCSELAFVGPVAERMLSERRADVAFISAAAFSIADGAMDYDDAEVAVKRAMIAASRKTYVTIDASKIDACAPLVIAALDAFDGVVVDDEAPLDVRSRLEEARLEVVVAVPMSAMDAGLSEPAADGTIVRADRRRT